MSIRLKHLQHQQYESWLRKVDDPDWCEHRYRDSKDSAMASAIRDLRDHAAIVEKLERKLAIYENGLKVTFGGFSEEDKAEFAAMDNPPAPEVQR